MSHRLTTFILRNPPTGPAEGGKEKKPKKPDSTGDDDDSAEENGTVRLAPNY